jgi:tetratricopeptide (TPR) repeat protein
VQAVEADSQAPWCEGPSHAACAARALALAKEAERLDARSCTPHALRARAEVAAGNAASGLTALSTAADQVSDRIPCLQQLAGIADSAHDETRWRGAVEKVATAGCTSDAECAGDLSWAANEQEAHGKLIDALALYKRAYERAPANDDLLERVARLAATAGLHTEAAEDYERLARKQPAEPRWRRAADAQRGAL